MNNQLDGYEMQIVEHMARTYMRLSARPGDGNGVWFSSAYLSGVMNISVVLMNRLCANMVRRGILIRRRPRQFSLSVGRRI